MEDLDFSLTDFDAAAALIYRHLSPTPQIVWPILSERCGCEVWVKHENHLPTGAFKVRGGLWYIANTRDANPKSTVVAATRGNHGQSVAFATRSEGLSSILVIPHGNSLAKNQAMKALGATLIEYGKDFNEAMDHAKLIADEQGYTMFPSFHPLLVQGVGTYSIELLSHVNNLHTVYVPIGLGSGICGMIAARKALGLSVHIVGVVAEHAPAYALSFQAGTLRQTDSAETMADGLAVRIPNEIALNRILGGVDRIVTVSEKEIEDAIRFYFTDTHNVAEGAGACTLAALLQEKNRMAGNRVGLILSGGNIDCALYARIIDQDSF